jgi:hypothetical protein
MIAAASPHTRFRASRCIRPVHSRKLSTSPRVSHRNRITLREVSVSARIPENVSTRQRKYSLRHGLSRWPRVAFQINRIAENKLCPFPQE